MGELCHAFCVGLHGKNVTTEKMAYHGPERLGVKTWKQHAACKLKVKTYQVARWCNNKIGQAVIGIKNATINQGAGGRKDIVVECGDGFFVFFTDELF